MRSWGNLDYGDDGVDGVSKSDMSTFHPSLYWQPAPPSRLELEGKLQERGRGQAEPGLLLRLSIPL